MCDYCRLTDGAHHPLCPMGHIASDKARLGAGTAVATSDWVDALFRAGLTRDNVIDALAMYHRWVERCTRAAVLAKIAAESVEAVPD